MKGCLLVLILLFAPQVRSQEKTHELCKVCHSQTVADFLTHPHFEKGLNCDTCHGASIKHRTSQGHTEPDRIAAPHEVPALCGSCHGGEEPNSILSQYAGSKHGKRVLEKARVRSPHCGTCHGVHNVLSTRAIETQCKRCHAQLPTACTAPSISAAKPVYCVQCHASHSFAVSK